MNNPTILQQLASDGDIRDELHNHPAFHDLTDAQFDRLAAVAEDIYAAVMAEDADLDLNMDCDDLANDIADEVSRAKCETINRVHDRLTRGEELVSAPALDELTYDVDDTQIYVDESDYGATDGDDLTIWIDDDYQPDGDDLAIWIDDDYQLTTEQARRWIAALSMCVDGIERRNLQRKARLMTAEAQERP